MGKSKLDTKILHPFILIILGILLISLDRGGLSNWIRRPISYIFEPVSFSSDSIAQGVSGWSYALTDASSYIAELNVLREDLAKSKSTETSVRLLEEENAALKQQISITNGSDAYALSKIQDFSPDGTLRINVGAEDSVEVGDVVSVGKFFVGIVTNADQRGSLVRTPINKASHYEVAIIAKDAKIDSTEVNSLIKATGVISGSTGGIKLENIGINADVEDGDYVVVRDERIGDILVVGRVVGLVNNPASTSKTGFVSPVFDYANLITVFVRTN